MTRTVDHGIVNSSSAPFPVVHVPVLLMYGEHDALVRKSMADRGKELMPLAEEFAYPKAGHSHFPKSPLSFNPELARFVSENAAVQ